LEVCYNNINNNEVCNFKFVSFFGKHNLLPISTIAENVIGISNIAFLLTKFVTDTSKSFLIYLAGWEMTDSV